MEKTQTNCRTGSGALMFLTGMGAGIAAAVLLAPRSGVATRRILGRKLEVGEDWVKERALDAQDCVRSYAEDIGDRMKEVAEAVGRS